MFIHSYIVIYTYHQHAQQKLLEDRKFEAGEAIAPKLLLHLMATAGADRFVTIDLHNQAPERPRRPKGQE